MTQTRPRTGIVAYLIARFVMGIFGWKVVGELPSAPRVVVIAYPHTSSWDMVFMLGVAWSLRLKVKWAGKRSLFRWPFGWLMRAWGGVMVDRSGKKNQVQSIADTIRQYDTILIAVAPEGTRRAQDRWKSGFYHIARAADVPVLCSFLDYGRKRGGIGPLVSLTGDYAADMDKFRAFYGDISGKHRDRESTIRIKEEDAGEDANA